MDVYGEDFTDSLDDFAFRWQIALRDDLATGRLWPVAILREITYRGGFGERPFINDGSIEGDYVLAGPDGKKIQGTLARATCAGMGQAWAWSDNAGGRLPGPVIVSARVTLNGATHPRPGTGTAATTTANVAREVTLHYGTPPALPVRACLVARHSGKVLNVAEASTGNGGAVGQWDWANADQQKFTLQPAGDGCYRIVAKHSGKILAVEGASTDNGACLIQWDSGPDNNEIFRLEPAGDGCYRLIAQHSGKVLAVEAASRDNDARILQWDSGSDSNEIFRVRALVGGEW